MLGRCLLPSGRRPRIEFWRGVALVLIAFEFGLPLSLFAFGLAAGFSATDPPFEAIGSVFLVVAALSAWSLAALSAQRLHDRGRSGWWALLLLVPVFGLVWTLAWNGVRRGTPGLNRFGPDPRGGAIAEAFDAGTVPVGRRRPPVASTIIAWSVLAATTAVMIGLLFYQSPSRPAAHASSSRPLAGGGVGPC